MALRRPRWAIVVSALSAHSFWYSCALASHHMRHLVEDIPFIHQSQANATSFVAVSGIKNSGNNTVLPRLEIRELERKPDDFNVFLLGLQRFQSIDQSDKLSYYQIAGTGMHFPHLLERSADRSRYPWRAFHTMG